MAIVAISLPLVKPVIQKVYCGLLASNPSSQEQRDSESYPGWVHIEWLRNIISISSRTGSTGRTVATATTGVIGDTRHDATEDEVELTRHPGLDPFADAFTQTHTSATGQHVHWEPHVPHAQNGMRVHWYLPPRSPVPGYESILEIVSPKKTGNFIESKSEGPA